jgi:prepilin-type processing-associated H-X9-DG protein
MVQGKYAAPSDTRGGTAAVGAFLQSIATNENNLTAKKLGAVQNTVATPVCGDGGVDLNQIDPIFTSWPDVCQIQCTFPGCCIEPGDAVYPPNAPDVLTDPGARKQYARHLGGVNLGFADGHAAWWPSERLASVWLEAVKTGQVTGLDPDFMGYPCGPWSYRCEQAGTSAEDLAPGYQFIF